MILPSTTPREEYERLPYASYSGLKTFLKCPRLFYERYITREHKDAEQDYFIYGHLVDCLVTQPSSLGERFVRVSRKSNGGTLNLEMEIEGLRSEIENLKPQAEAGKKRAAASIKKYEKEILEKEEQIAERQGVQGRTQVTNALWEDAVETAEAINQNPYLQHLRGSYECLPQVVLVDEVMKRKGIIDLLFINVQNDIVIVDIKTTFRLRELNPEDYAPQLALYRDLVRQSYDHIRSIRCMTIVGDKDPTKKMCQDFEYSEETLDRHMRIIEDVELSWSGCVAKEFWPSARELRGREQECFSCSQCSVRPFSQSSHPVLI